ncbi:MAG TPA: AMP-binding protein [Candidatus Limnocylindria bacterium]|nr:AMP-binding protein [Candidatus Limnocylindria bacterium]
MTAVPLPYGARIATLAASHPDRVAIVDVDVDDGSREVAYTWRELDRATRRVAAVMRAAHADLEVAVRPAARPRGPRVTVVLPNSADHLVACIAAWRLGALVLPVSPRLPARERIGLLDTFQPSLIVGSTDVAVPTLTEAALHEAAWAAWEPPSDIPDPLPWPGKAVGSGGSTGRSKVVVDPASWGWSPTDDEADAGVGFRPGQTQLVAGPLYHNSPFVWSTRGLLLGQRIILLRRFDARVVVEQIERHQVQWLFLAPTMMHRIIRLEDIAQRDLGSIEMLFHTAGPCAPALKRAWINLLGGERIVESYGSSEAIGHTRITGGEWLQHPGSVGRADGAEVRILDESGRELPAREVGEIFMRRNAAGPTYEYIGAPPARSDADGFTSVGDHGWLDEEGYLYLADRRDDLVVSGGVNVYPAEVEGALLEHPRIADVAVIGLPDDEWGQRVHAIVEPRANTIELGRAELHEFLRDRIAAYKRPKSYELVERLPRDESGKIRRRQLVEERRA